MRRMIVLATVLSLLLSVGPVNAVAPVQAGRGGSTDARAADRYIVVLRDDADLDLVQLRARTRFSVVPFQTYRYAVKGFSASLTPWQLGALRADPAVAFIEGDRVVQLAGQVLPTGINRVDADLSPTAAIDGTDTRVNADVAIIDTGIQKDHEDLNVAGGVNCTDTGATAPTDWGDGNGHGTHVAGIVGAIDNTVGVVGVAPGARVWAVRVFRADGYSLLSWIVCGIDWVTAQKDPLDTSKPLFEAANMSLRDAGSDDGNCGNTNDDAEHRAICASVAAGTTYAVAAGNDSTSASKWIPAAYPEVITVSALADFDGKPGGLAASTCSSFNSADSDDTFADFSNFGPPVDLIAPGKCIYSTYSTAKSTGTGYAVLSGTSMASPHVAGAIALYKAEHPAATPADVKAALQGAATLDWFTNTDPDATHERLLNVSSFGATPPSAPTNVTATAGNAQATVSFSAPASDGGSPITSYTVTSTPGNLTATGASSSTTVTGLTNGTPYTFTVHATNAAGPGPESSASNSVTPTAPLTITTTTLPAGRVNRSYSATVQVTGGTLPYTWKIASGALPPGLTLGASTGTISGTPTKPGSYSFTVSVSDSATPAQAASKAFSIKITRK